MLVIGIASLIIRDISLAQITSTIDSWFSSPKFLIIAVSLILVTVGASAFISKIMNSFSSRLPSSEDARGIESAGLYIGIFERLIILALTITGNFVGIGFIFAAKSVIRFPDANINKHFAEYYLIGTMTSFAVALLIGFVARLALNHIGIFT